MGDSYTVFWSQRRVGPLEKLPADAKPFSLLFGGPHISQPSFSRAGVRLGDLLYPISVSKGYLQILGRMQVLDLDRTSFPTPAEFLRYTPDAAHANKVWI